PGTDELTKHEVARPKVVTILARYDANHRLNTRNDGALAFSRYIFPFLFRNPSRSVHKHRLQRDIDARQGEKNVPLPDGLSRLLEFVDHRALLNRKPSFCFLFDQVLTLAIRV